MYLHFKLKNESKWINLTGDVEKICSHVDYEKLLPVFREIVDRNETGRLTFGQRSVQDAWWSYWGSLLACDLERGKEHIFMQYDTIQYEIYTY